MPVAANTSEGVSTQLEARDVGATSLGHVEEVTEFHTIVGVITGTVGYMSPEQASGDATTSASDMYSFGLLLQELFTGRPPYDRR